MSQHVHKYGGSSMAIERIAAVADRIIASRDQGHDIVAVVSAMTGDTDRLIGLASSVTQLPDLRELDALLSTGEQVSAALLCMALHQRGCPARSLNGAQLPIRTNGDHTYARILDIDVAELRHDLLAGRVPVVTGFQGVSDNGEICTLGRGGSDTSAVALAAALEADECRIYTDVDGIYTTDPRIVDGASRLSSITYEEMLEMSSLGAKILQIRAVQMAWRYNVPLRVLSSFKDGTGTLVTSGMGNMMEAPEIAGIPSSRNEAKITVLNVPDVPGAAFQILGPVADAGISVDVIVQNVAENGSTGLTFTVPRDDMRRAMSIVDNAADSLGALPPLSDDRIAKVSVVGVGMRSHAGVAARMFEALAAERINIQLISTSETKISVVIDERFLELAVRALHSAFHLDDLAAAAPSEERSR